MAKTARRGIDLAYDYLPGRPPVVVFLPGYASDMEGNKALHLREACAARGQAMLRLDYAGHGASGGNLIDGCIGDWTADAAAVIATAAPDAPLLLVGSSMGGWIALLLALGVKTRVTALLLIAPAADFTENLLRPRLPPEALARLEALGVIETEGAPPITLKLLEDGVTHLLLTGPIALACPVRILHGMNDASVPWETSIDIAACLDSDDVRLTFIKDGDHRLSRRQDLALLEQALFDLLGQNRA